jgi:hypothetical protein
MRSRETKGSSKTKKKVENNIVIFHKAEYGQMFKLPLVLKTFLGLRRSSFVLILNR